MKKLLLIATVFASLQVRALSCGTDTIIGYNVETETQGCSTAGYCTMFSFNPESGNYENYYGFHPLCPGTQERRNEKYLCQREDLTNYEDNSEGFWGACNITPF